MPYQPKVSIVINTDGRAQPLAVCLDSLRYLRYPGFEVIVVAGPTRDGTHELCASWGDAIKYGYCPVRNLSQSRNIGIAMAAGDIVAFIDDDAVPEPEWLDDVVRAFEDGQVGVAGGFLHDHTGKTYQWKYGTANRFAGAEQSWVRPAPEFNFPFSFNYPHVIGANSIFRRAALVEVGGFDEEYEYFLDETDLTLRIVDAGWTVAQLDRAFVHHKFMPSHIRNQAKVLTSWYAVIKNKAYFAVVHGANYAPVEQILGEVQRFIMELRYSARWAVEERILTGKDLERFEDEAQRGLRDGLARGFSGVRRIPPREFLRSRQHAFVRFPTLLPAARQRCYVMLTRGYPPANVGGVARYIHQLARTLAARGHQVHVLTAGEGHDRVDFEHGVWVHRIVARSHPAPQGEALRGIPPQIWNHSRTMLDEAREIAARRAVDAVYGPIWDAEGVAFLHQPGLPLVTSLQTTLRFYLDSNPHLQKDAAFMRDFAEPMLRVERLMLEQSDGIHAISDAITREIESAYGVTLDRDRLWMVPLGLEDWTGGAPPAPAPDAGVTRVCFIGRLESRKGVDLVMEIAPALLRDHPQVRLEFVGNDRIAAADGRTWRQRFEEQPGFDALADRVVFRGEVGDAQLRQAYRDADVVVAPSRFESFGLVHLEAAMYGKPVVGCRSGGMVEVVEDGVTGLLAEPGDPQSLLRALAALLGDPALRERMGRAARQRYLERFTPDRMADGVAAMFDVLVPRTGIAPVAGSPPEPEPMPAPPAPEPEVPPALRAGSGLRIALVGSVLAPYDAISNDLVRMAQMLGATPGWEVTVFAGHNQRKDVAAKVFGRVSDLLLAPQFLQADVIIYHFGIYYPLFDTLLIGNGRAPQAVVFHNITPLEFAPPGSRDVIEQSFAQLAHLHAADAIWADSRENFEMLEARGFETGRMAIQPLAVDRPPRCGIRKPYTGTVQVLFIGRIVPSKGIQDLVEALALLETGRVRVQVKVVGNMDAADKDFRARLLARIEELRLADRFAFLGHLTDDERDRLLGESHVLAMPSYHEGFCVPVVEALRAGMLPVVYAAHNLRYIADGLCVSAPPGDVAAFAAALGRAVADMDAVLRAPGTAHLRTDRGALTPTRFEEEVAAHVEQFEPSVVAGALRAKVAQLARTRQRQPSAA